jgi:hypothetical protein
MVVSVTLVFFRILGMLVHKEKVRGNKLKKIIENL